MSDLEERLEDIIPSYGPGSVLKAKREEYEWAIESVAQALHLSTAHIKSIEDDRYDQLPGSTYVIGYWRSYARLLGIDMEETIEANKRNLQVVQPKSSGINVNRGRVQKSDHGKGLVWLLGSAIILAGLGYAWKTGMLDPQKILDVTQLEQENADSVVEEVVEVEEEGVLRKVEQELTERLNESSSAQTVITASADIEEEVPEAVSLVSENTSLATQTDQVDSQDAEKLEAIDETTIASSALTTTDEQSGVVQAQASDATSTVSTVAVPADTNLLVMQLNKDSWLDVRDKSNKRLIYRSGKSGEKIDLRGEPPFYVYIGTPDGVKITYLNENVPFESHQSGLFARFKLGEVLENL